MPRPKSDSLFHLTKSLDTVKSILKAGAFWPSYSLEPIESITDYEIHEKIAFPIVCFCDIPLGRISEHVDFYGRYGFGLSRDWAIAKGLNPVIYTFKESPLAESIKSSLYAAALATGGQRELQKRGTLPESFDFEFMEHVRRLAAFVKPLRGEVTVDGIRKTKEFLQESEWRFVATPRGSDITPFLQRVEYGNEVCRRTENENVALKRPLCFSPQNVTYVFVSKESEIPDLVRFVLDNPRGGQPSNDQLVLLTRITSLERIELDL